MCVSYYSDGSRRYRYNVASLANTLLSLTVVLSLLPSTPYTDTAQARSYEDTDVARAMRRLAMACDVRLGRANGTGRRMMSGMMRKMWSGDVGKKGGRGVVGGWRWRS